MRPVALPPAPVRAALSQPDWRGAAGGYTLLEVLASIAILGILLAVALPRQHADRLQIANTQRLVIGSLRGARASALSKSVHFAIEFAASDYLKVARMYSDSSGWHLDTSSVRIVRLPPRTHLAATTVGTRVEFDTHGSAINLTAPRQVDVYDDFGVHRGLQAWPSGQINEL